MFRFNLFKQKYVYYVCIISARTGIKRSKPINNFENAFDIFQKYEDIGSIIYRIEYNKDRTDYSARILAGNGTGMSLFINRELIERTFSTNTLVFRVFL